MDENEVFAAMEATLDSELERVLSIDFHNKEEKKNAVYYYLAFAGGVCECGKRLFGDGLKYQVLLKVRLDNLKEISRQEIRAKEDNEHVDIKRSAEG